VHHCGLNKTANVSFQGKSAYSVTAAHLLKSIVLLNTCNTKLSYQNFIPLNIKIKLVHKTKDKTSQKPPVSTSVYKQQN
jgi:hypothetical protein